MTNSSDRESYNSETRQESYTDSYGNTHTNLTRTSETVNNNPNNVNSSRNGYVNGRELERNYQQANLAARDDENASRGLLLGILLTSLAGLIVGAFWYFNQPRETVVEETQPVVTPSPSNDVLTPSFTPQPQQTTIIERTREVPVERTREVPVIIPQPQPQAPSINVTPSAPEINVTVPPQQPATSRTQTTSPRNSSTDTPAAGTGSNTSETTVPSRSDESNNSSNSDSSTTGDGGTDNSTPQ